MEALKARKLFVNLVSQQFFDKIGGTERAVKYLREHGEDFIRKAWETVDSQTYKIPGEPPTWVFEDWLVGFREP